MSFEKPDRHYWDDKFAAYLHDPFDKVFRIQGHARRSGEILKRFGLDMPNDDFWKKADGIASGFERGQVPSFSKDESQNGAVDFIDQNGIATISHPIGSNGHLQVKVQGKTIDEVHQALVDFIEEKIGTQPNVKNYSNLFRDDHDRFCQARFLYAHLLLRFQLAEQNKAGLGGLWHRLPADTRFPDHSIWQHNALTSALYSSMRLAGGADNIGLMVFSLAPVQGFIENARKLRDFWSGSVLLSWLAFEGLRWVMENLGPDHVLYPSLIDQPLVLEYLANNWQMEELIKSTKTLSQVRDIGSLPNKFVLLLPLNHASDIAAGIQNAIQTAWKDIGDKVLNWLFYDKNGIAPEAEQTVRSLFAGQMGSFWELQWSAAKLLGIADKGEYDKLLPAAVSGNVEKLYHLLSQTIADKPHYENEGKGTLYTLSHQLAQSALAAQKLRRRNQRPEQANKKCSLCGEYEALHHIGHQSGDAVKLYNSNLSAFWQFVAKRLGSGAEKDIRANEQLCAICLTKRLAYRVIKNDKQHVLSATFTNAGNFPSTTEMAHKSWFGRHKILPSYHARIGDAMHSGNPGELRKILSELNIEAPAPVNYDNYYAILMMDGDKMGKLVAGETLAANWQSIMHPVSKKRLENNQFSKHYRESWQQIFKEIPKRHVTPAIHAAISEALGDFALNGVFPIIERHSGKLVYAGGDDVAAILPVATVLVAASEISQFYNSGFKQINGDGSIQPIAEEYEPEAGKLSVLLGNGDDISLSAGILICHHKESLTAMLTEANDLLKNEAKSKAGRNACAIRLRKRSGGARTLYAKWDSKVLQAFDQLLDALAKDTGQQLSRSLVYRLSHFDDGFNAILSRKDKDANGLLQRFILSLMDKSGLTATDEAQVAAAMDLLLSTDKEMGIAALQMAAFLSGKETQQ
jgi:CRISPR-associated protein Cmr2